MDANSLFELLVSKIVVIIVVLLFYVINLVFHVIDLVFHVIVLVFVVYVFNIRKQQKTNCEEPKEAKNDSRQSSNIKRSYSATTVNGQDDDRTTAAAINNDMNLKSENYFSAVLLTSDDLVLDDQRIFSDTDFLKQKVKSEDNTRKIELHSPTQMEGLVGGTGPSQEFHEPETTETGSAFTAFVPGPGHENHKIKESQTMPSPMRQQNNGLSSVEQDTENENLPTNSANQARLLNRSLDSPRFAPKDFKKGKSNDIVLERLKNKIYQDAWKMTDKQIYKNMGWNKDFITTSFLEKLVEYEDIMRLSLSGTPPLQNIASCTMWTRGINPANMPHCQVCRIRPPESICVGCGRKMCDQRECVEHNCRSGMTKAFA